MMAGPAYITTRLATVQAARLAPAPHGLGPLARHLRAVIGNPGANSDALLITADALRLAAADPTDAPPAYRAALRAWADTLADLAPTRANQVEADA
jgi:hypothetical protein